MFTGIIESTGIVSASVPLDLAIRFMVRAQGVEQRFSVGDSVSVNGVCLTVVALRPGEMEFDVVEETLRRTTLGWLEPGSRVNLEPPVSLSSMLGGHLVQGHVDAVGVVRRVEDRGVERWVEIALPQTILRYVVEKGSIAVEGVSLTVAAVDEESFSVALIPHTAAVTTLGDCTKGSSVNVEVDILAKHLEKLAVPYLAGRSA